MRKNWNEMAQECCIVIETNIDKKACKTGGVQIRCDTGIPGEKSGLKYPKPLQFLLSVTQVNLFKS